MKPYNMPNFNFNKIVDEQEKARPQTAQSSGWMKIANGDNRVRILSDAAKYPEHSKYDDSFEDGDYTGICVGLDDNCPACMTGRLKPSIKYLFWVIDRKDNQIKLAKLTYGVVKHLQSLTDDVDYAFSTFPMPYDLNIKYDSTAAPVKKYSLVAARTNTPITEAEAKDLATQTPVDQIVQKIKDKKIKELTSKNEEAGTIEVAGVAVPYPVNEVDPKDIPF